MKKYIITIGIFLLCLTGFSQNETNVWYFGINTGLDFNGGAPVLYWTMYWTHKKALQPFQIIHRGYVK